MEGALLIGFDHEHITKVGRGENGGRTLAELTLYDPFVRSANGLRESLSLLSERYPDGQDVADGFESSDGKIVGAGRSPPVQPKEPSQG